MNIQNNVCNSHPLNKFSYDTGTHIQCIISCILQHNLTMQCDGQKDLTSGARDSSVGRAPDQIQGPWSESWSSLSLILPSHNIWYLDQVLKRTG